jgi:hypothetical protein
MSRSKIMAALAAVVLAAAAVASTATAADPSTTVDFASCAFGSGAATLPAGVPIVVTDTGSSATGTYGTASNVYKKTSVTAVITRGGAAAVMPLTLSQPAFVAAPFFAWLVFVPDVQLAPLAAGQSATVAIDRTTTGPEEIVFPGQHGPHHFGPFHVGAGEMSEDACVITAA